MANKADGGSNGLPQGNVLTPMLFNTYTNDQPVSPKVSFIHYAADLSIAAQNPK